MSEKERYATIGTWVEVFREEGVSISDASIRGRLKEAGIIGETARLQIGQLLRDGFYAESDVRRACHDLLNPLNAAYFSDPSRILHDLTAYARQLGEDKVPPDLSTYNIYSLFITCRNGETVKGATYLNNAAVALDLAKDSKEADSKRAEILTLLLKTAGIEVRDENYFRNQEIVHHDLTAYARQLGEDKNPLDISTKNIASLSLTCHNGETVKGKTYLDNAAVALGLAKGSIEARSKRAEILQILLKTAGVEIRDNSYYRNKDFVFYDLTAYAQKLGEGKTPLDLCTKNISSLSITCHNGETVKGQAYLRNAAVAFGLAKDSIEAKTKPAKTLRALKEIAGFLTPSNDR